MVADWLAATRRRRDALMLASRRRDVQDLNRAARAALVDRGEVRADGVEIDGRVFAVGDSVMALSNRRRLDITNGDRGVITDVNPARTKSRSSSTAATPSCSPRRTSRAGHLTHAYATTIHKAQGLTCDRALLLADDSIFQEAGYTALTRGRERNQLYVVRSEEVDDNLERSRARTPDELIDDLTGALFAIRNKRLAIDQTASSGTRSRSAVTDHPDRRSGRSPSSALRCPRSACRGCWSRSRLRSVRRFWADQSLINEDPMASAERGMQDSMLDAPTLGVARSRRWAVEREPALDLQCRGLSSGAGPCPSAPRAPRSSRRRSGSRAAWCQWPPCAPPARTIRASRNRPLRPFRRERLADRERRKADDPCAVCRPPRTRRVASLDLHS